jgi:hypothetical protein
LTALISRPVAASARRHLLPDSEEYLRMLLDTYDQVTEAVAQEG